MFLALFVLLSALLAAAQQPPPARRDLKVETEPGAEAPKVTIPRSYAVVIGVARYPNLDANLQLRYAERDAEAIYSILISPEGGNFKAENVHKLVGAKATLAAMRRELEQWLPSVARDGDRVLLYFAGHGFVYQGQAYLAPNDFDKSRIRQSGYSMETLGAVMGGKVKAKDKVLLTDACHSGALTPEDSASINRRLFDLNRSLFSLTASRDREQSFEGEAWGGGHGIFTYYTVKGLEGEADENRNGVVTADELANYVRTNVREATGGKQNPTSDRGSFDPEMLLAYVPSNARPGAPPPPKFGTLIFEANMDGVELFVDGNQVGVLSKGKPLTLPGLVPGKHTIQGVKMGYEPDGPREETVYPGQETTVTIKILIARRRNKAASDAFDKGMEFYNKGFAENYKKAAEQFRKALGVDPNYSQAALYLARTLNALFEEGEAQKWFRRALEIDPDYLEARASYGGMLLDIGDIDESIRQLNRAVQRQPDHALAQTMLSQAYRWKEMYPESIAAAEHAIRLVPQNGESHLWLAESLRKSGQYERARKEYDEYLRLSNFDSKLAGKLNYYALGYLFGMGKKKRAAQQDIWKELRSLAYFGMCDCSRLLKNYDQAIDYCQRSLTYDPGDPYAHYALGLSYKDKANQTNSIETLPAALKHFAAVVDINPDLSEAGFAKRYIALIQEAVKNR